jgi:cysteine desulfurase
VRDNLYLDYAATAPLHPEAAAAVLAAQGLIGNPGSAHGAGLAAAEALSAARNSIALLLGFHADDVVFTSGGSESNTMALWGTFAARRFSGHLVTTSIEHSSVLENARALEELGVEVTFVDPGPTGHVAADDIAAAMRPNTALVSVMHANNETGAIQPIEQIAAITREAGVPLHVDAVQTAGKIPVAGLGAQLVSIAGHKFGAPRGVGALAVARRCRLAPLIRGGSQEHGRRAGTENVAGAAGLAAAAQVCMAAMSPSYRDAARVKRTRLVDGLLTLGGVHLNSVAPVLEETISIRFDGVRADTLADALDLQDIYVSTGSACHAHEDAVSHVLIAQGLTEEEARSALRISFGAELSFEEIDRVVAAAVQTVERLRRTAGRATVLQ